MDDFLAAVGGRAVRSGLDVLHVELYAEPLVCEHGCCSVSGVPHLQVYAVALACAEYVRRRMPQICHCSKQAWMIVLWFVLSHRAQPHTSAKLQIKTKNIFTALSCVKGHVASGPGARRKLEEIFRELEKSRAWFWGQAEAIVRTR